MSHCFSPAARIISEDDAGYGSKTIVASRLARATGASRARHLARWKAQAEPSDVLIRVYRRDVVVSHPELIESDPTRAPGPGRGRAGPMSRRTARRIGFLLNNMDIVFRSMLTLTYPRKWPYFSSDVAEHRDDIIRWLRRNYPTFAFFWVWEWQQRGAPHLHIGMDFEPCAAGKPLARGRMGYEGHHDSVNVAWQRAIREYSRPEGYGPGATWERVRSDRGFARYLSCYLGKGPGQQQVATMDYPGAWWGRSHGLADPTPELECWMPSDQWIAGMGSAAVGRCGTRYALIHDGRAKLDAAFKRMGIRPMGTPPPPGHGRGGEILQP